MDRPVVETARRDFASIVAWSADRFGDVQARRYADLVSSTIARLGDGPTVAGARPRPEIAAGLLTLHVGRTGRRARHLVPLRGDPSARSVDVLRILHDAMDLARHVDGDDG